MSLCVLGMLGLLGMTRALAGNICKPPRAAVYRSALGNLAVLAGQATSGQPIGGHDLYAPDPRLRR